MNVLILGRHPVMLHNALTLLKQNGYVATGYTTDDEITQALQTTAVDLVVIGGGVEATSRAHIKATAGQVAPRTKVLDVYGPHHLLKAVNGAQASIWQKSS
jgi:DNA-binding NarL/FixJ family response regulator